MLFFWLIAGAIALPFLTGCSCPWKGADLSVAQSNSWIQNGMAAARAGRHHQAEESLKQAIAVRPVDPVLREHLADSYVQQGKLQLAIEQLTYAVGQSENDAELLVKLGSLYLENGQWIPAAQFATLALETDRELPQAWALRAETKLVKGQLSDALADYQRALSHRSDYPEVQLKVAEVQQSLGRPLRAFSTVEKLLNQTSIEQQSESALLLAGRLLLEISQPAQAIEKLQIAAARENASADCFVQLSNAQLAFGQPSQARLTLVNAQNLHPDSALIASRLNDLQENIQSVASLGPPNGDLTR